ncbi:MAG: phosphatidylserine/phosphatidylglycerophosphate/cardiolipin synthase family protein [Gammaproteobacteria bacterium]|nr:phosphatidylserine/phosphatidylglycerophosphate/cardiolipin synthase family protein [Gammaproteobacteria bacterium]
MGITGKISTLVVTALLATGCASTAHDASSFSRKATGIGQASWIYARSVYENPINRPVSHVTTLGSYALKSTGGLLRRISLSTLEMPALRSPIPAVGRAAPMDLDAFEKILDKTTGTRLDKGRIRFLVDGDEYFGRLMESIDSAQESIDMRTYIFDNDDFGAAMADELRQRADEVRVRVMIDSLGNMLALQADAKSLPDGHRHPLSMRQYLKRDSNVKVRKTTNPWFTGDHTKTTIIDRKLAFVGGMNIGREYRHDWHDMMMEVTGPVVDQLQFESDKAWSRGGLFGDFANAITFLRGKKEHADRDGYPVRILQTRSFDSQIHKAQIAAIQNARSYILIENAYFSDDRTVYELARARRRGVDVRVIIPSRGNHGPLNASNKITINKFLEHGIRVYEYPGMSHIKAAIYDGWMCVGSANFDKLSLKVNKELNLATSDPETVDALLNQVFIPDLLASREIHEPFAVTVPTRIAEIAVDELM